ncbi:MAG: PspC domain-containing protein, partial [Actinomycetota bacterium]|nr:PspC domain-containing protein [Actinomycetota bacterium]
MTTTHPTESWWQVPRLDKDKRIATGVAAGIAEEIGVEPVVVRTAFVVLTITGGWGVALYVAMWLWAAVRGDRCAVTSRPKGRSERHRLLAIGSCTLGLMLSIRELRLGFVDSLVWPTTVLALGFLVVWRRANDDDVDLTTSLSSRSSRWTGVRILIGIAMAAGGVATLLAFNLDLSAARHMVLAGLGLILGPWIMRIVDDLTRERRLRIRSEERTEVAAHLHDSVLQTLALIQRNADDKQAMVQLARRQERKLRDWLYGGGGATEASLRRSIVDLAAEVEELHGVP